MSIKVGGADNVSIKTISGFPQGFFISESVNNHDDRIHQVLIKQNFHNGSSLFHGVSHLNCQELRKVCNGSLDRISDEEIHAIMIYYVQRIRNYGHIESLWRARLKQARIVPMLTPRTGVCEYYEGKVISVEQAYNTIQWFKTLSPEEYGKQIAIKDFSIPPLYFGCRCSLEGVIPGLDNTYERFVPKPKEKTVWDYLNEFQVQSKKIDGFSSKEFEEIYNLGLKVSEMLKNYSFQRARVERQIGEILLAREDKTKALLHLEKAYQIDNKVGVKNLLQKLRENL